MSSVAPKYIPISCDFHDLLEATATTRKFVAVQFVDGGGSLQHCSAGIVDLYSRTGSEYVVLSTGETLRLDCLTSVDGMPHSTDRRL